MDRQRYKNTYVVVRHGESTANKQCIIVSSAAHALNSFGLTAKGTEQVLRNTLRSNLNCETLIVSSDFKRTLETAVVIGDLLNTNPVITDQRLRERDFGNLELKTHEFYPQVWQEDENPSQLKTHKVESVESVLGRGLAVIADLEQQHSGRLIALVGHGDVLQILLAYHAGLNPIYHRQLTPLDNAEIRSLLPSKSEYGKPNLAVCA